MWNGKQNVVYFVEPIQQYKPDSFVEPIQQYKPDPLTGQLAVTAISLYLQIVAET